jgi:hypothetical protein
MPYAADDFEAIRGRMEELSRERVDRHVDTKILGKPTNPEGYRDSAPPGGPSRRSFASPGVNRELRA